MKSMLEDVISQQRIQRWVNAPNHQLTIGLINHSERMVWTQGNVSEDDGSKSIYEIGSITKTLIGLLLAIGEHNGKWHRSDPISDYVPEWSSSLFAQRTTLLHLVTHTAGLPDVPGNFKSTITDQLNPYANYTENYLIEAVLAENRRTKNKFRYSNYGFGLLGWVLSKRLGQSLNDALREQIFKPLGMINSGIGLKFQASNRILPVFNSKGKPVPHWDFLDTMAGAGAVCSTISDMLNYIEAHLSLSDHSLTSALAECRKAHHVIFPSKGIGIGYGWMFFKEKDGSTTYWHNGATYGSSSFATFNRDKGIGLIILSNYGLDVLSQLPLIGMRKMNVDKLAYVLTNKLFKEV